MTTRSFAAALLCLLWGLDAPGQGVWTPGGKEPTTVPADPRGLSKEPLRCYVTRGGADVLADPRDPKSVLRQAPYLDGGTLYCVAAVHKGAGGEPLWLLAEPLDPDNFTPGDGLRQVAGWVRADRCLGFTDRNLRGLRDPESLIHRKAMLVHTLDRIRAGAVDKMVSFADRPGGEPRAELRLFEILYVFDEADGHLLLGTDPEVYRRSRSRTAGDMLLGWVPEDRVCRWNTREAIEFNKEDIGARTQPAVIYPDWQGLRQYLLDRPSAKKVERGEYAPAPIAVEDLSVKGWLYSQPRFPIVPAADAEERKYQGNFFDRLGGFRVWKVGVIGDVVNRQGSGVIVSATKLAALREQTRRLKDDVATIQIAFVINAAFGMNQYVGAAETAVRDIINAVRNLGDGDVRPTRVEFSVNFYRDRVDGPDVFEGHPFTDKASEVIEQLQPFHPTDNPRGVVFVGGGPPPDAVNLGVCRALRDAEGKPRFRPNATKLLVLIGNGCNDPAEREYTLQRVCREIKEAGGSSPVAFYAVAVGDQDVPEYARFRDEATKIAADLQAHQRQWLANRLGTRGGEVPEAMQAAVDRLTGQVVVSTDVKEITDAIRGRFELALAEIRFKAGQLEDLERGVVPKDLPPEVLADLKDPDAASYGVIWQNQILDQMEKQGLQPLVLARAGVQLFHTGWVCERAPLEFAPPGAAFPPPTVRHSVLVQKDELRNLAVVLNRVLRDWERPNLEVSWVEALNTVTGGEVRVQRASTPAELTRLNLGIQLHHGLLGLSFAELSRVDAARLAELRLYLELRRDRIEDVLDEVETEYTLVEEGGRRYWRRGPGQRERLYWWPRDNRDAQRAWVDRETLP